MREHIWLLVLSDDEGAWAIPFSSRARALVFALSGWTGRVYWKRRHRVDSFYQSDAWMGATYQLYQAPIDEPP